MVPATAKLFDRKRHVCARRCRSATPCTRVRTRDLFCIDPLTHPATEKTKQQKLEIAKSQNRDLRFLKIANRQSSKLLRANLEPIALQRAAPFFIEWATRVQSSRFTFCRFPMRSHKDAQGGLLHLNSAPNEATTSIWLKAMMVCRDLRGNNEPSENGIRHGGGDWEPEGRSSEGASRG